MRFTFASKIMTNSDVFDYSLIAAGILAVIVLVVGGIRRQGNVCMRLLKMIAAVTLSILAGYSWTLVSLYIGFTIIGADWSGKSDTWLSELAFRSAIPCGIAVAIFGVFLTIRWLYRKPSSTPNHKGEQAVPSDGHKPSSRDSVAVPTAPADAH